ncbi:MAG: 3-isopropylmalate dehydratase small subunit [Spirochaetaceae bacterium]|jgi:3-isopropylmalate/(R)-2-methylmalate dehydratase small subunit|nr:3-isopropylmalate dehydratase small subunit [Spirochaetaceae bacterium]
MKEFGGNVLFLDRSNINTDEIIPAKYLTENSKEALAPFLLEDLELAGFNPKQDIAGKAAVVTRENFGCGSSREHAPWALEMNGIHIVIAPSFARIFRQNMYNCGLLAVELEASVIDSLFAAYAGKRTALSVDTKAAVLTFQAEETGAGITRVPFVLRGFERALVEAGGWVEYTAARY